MSKVYCAFQMTGDPDGWPTESLISVFRTREDLLTKLPTAIEKKRTDVKEEEVGGYQREPFGPIVFEEFEVLECSAEKKVTGFGEIIEWNGKKWRLGRCSAGDTCLACDRLGYHIEPLEPR